ncbi:MAG: hypothetical protein FWG75_06150 [Cystobacterineae bacterium]|nr:hypothetical protein [Cystobacterineae bacterium]
MSTPRKSRRRLQRGQAMVEYSLIGHVLMVGGVAAAWPFFTVLMNAFNAYYQGIFFVLTSPVP